MPLNPLPLKKIHHVELLVGNAKQAAFYYRHAFGFSQLAYAGPETGVREQASYVLQQGDIRLVASTPLFLDDPMADHLRRRGDGVLDIALPVENVESCYQESVRLGAKAMAIESVLVTVPESYSGRISSNSTMPDSPKFGRSGGDKVGRNCEKRDNAIHDVL